MKIGERPAMLGLANGGIFLLAVTCLVLSLPLPPSRPQWLALAGLGLCATGAWSLRRRSRAELAGELRRRQEAEQAARAADRAKGQFLANVSHEIRTPMNGILGMTEILLRDALTPVQRDRIELIQSSAQALLSLVDDILDLSRIEAGRLVLRPRDFHLRRLADEVVRLLASQADEQEVDLRLHVDPALPEDLHGDPARLRQVLLNLVGNAIRFTHRGSVKVFLETEADTGGAPAFRCRVEDTGVGIRPEVQARLFQPFVQADSSVSLQSGGTGLGLVISRNIVELMGGTIGFESVQGQGSTFWFRLPLVPAHGDRDRAPVLGSAATVRRQARRERRILVVDDRSANRAVALVLLREIGYSAAVAESGEEALALLQEGAFDLLLLDCEMPGLDGIETCRQLRRQEGSGRHLPVIAVTAHTSPGEKERCLAAGMDGYLAKPFRMADLAALLDRWTAIEPAADALEERLAALAALEAKTGEAVLTEVVASFLQQSESDLSELRRAVPPGEAEAAFAAAHGLAGSSALLGAADLARSAAEVATLARQGELDAVAARLPALEREVRAIASRLRQLYPEHGLEERPTTNVEKKLHLL